MNVLLEARAITKRFGSFTANDQVNMQVLKGEIHAVVGENGAGKSTLMKILYGMLAPDSGELFFDGKARLWSSAEDALRAGIGMVHQHFMLISRMSVIENLILGAEPCRRVGVIDFKRAAEQLSELNVQMGTALAPHAAVEDLTVGEEQRLEILKLLYRESSCLIFDEPTGVLTPQEVEKFLFSLQALKVVGKTIVLITHKLHEVLSVADRITVLRAGKSVATVGAKDVSQGELARLLVGREVRALDRPLARAIQAKEMNSLLELKKVSAGKLRDASFSLHAGEIVGIAGIEGSGQRDLAEAIHGTRPLDSGSVSIYDRRQRRGLSYIPDDRHKNALVLDMNLEENLYLGASDSFPSRLFVPLTKVHRKLRESISQFDIRCGSPLVTARSLSGGNQQKLVIARELLRSPNILIASQPTRGVDIGASERIHDELMRRRNEGMGILLISSELDELLTLSDRILVLAEGRVAAEISDLRGDWTSLRFKIGEAMLWHS